MAADWHVLFSKHGCSAACLPDGSSQGSDFLYFKGRTLSGEDRLPAAARGIPRMTECGGGLASPAPQAGVQYVTEGVAQQVDSEHRQ